MSTIIENANTEIINATNNTEINKEDTMMENKNMTETIETVEATETIIPETPVRGNIWASYDSEKVEAILNGADPERKAWYETQGITLENCQSLESVLKLSGMDFDVKKKPMYFNATFDEVTEDGKKMPPKFIKIPSLVSTTRMDTGVSLGVVSDKYEILQNRDAFNFLDSMCYQGAKFETAGFFKKNQAANYITMSTEPMEILGDEFDPYIMITNSFDGSIGLRVVLTAIRAVCRNTALMALKHARTSISIKHTKTMEARMEEAKEILLANSKYMEELKKLAEELAVKPFSQEAFEALCKKLYPVSEDMSQTLIVRNIAQIEHLMKAYKENDLQNFKGRAWGALQAVSDHESHPLIFKKTTKMSNSGSPEFQVMMAGMPLLTKAYKIIKESV